MLKTIVTIEFHNDTKKYWMTRDNKVKEEYGPYTFEQMINVLEVINSEINPN